MLKLAHLNAFWPPGYKCELLKIDSDTIERIARMPDHSNTILLLDSIDEDPQLNRADSLAGTLTPAQTWMDTARRIEDLLTETIGFRRVIITCRTQFFPSLARQEFLHERHGHVSVGPFSCPSIYLSPFSVHQVDAYLAKRFPRSFFQWLFRMSSPKRARARELVNVMHSLRMRPMLLSYIDQLIDANLSVTTSYDVYNVLVDYWLRREHLRARLQHRTSLTAESLWAASVFLASHLDRTGNQLIPPAELFIIAANDPALCELEFLDFGGRSLLNRTSDGSYRFAHYSLQEFILARAMVGMRGTPGNDGTPRLRDVRGTTEVAQFLSEAVRSKHVRSIAEVSFDGTVFSQLDFSGLQFERCVFRRIKFQMSDLRRCKFEQCTFIECDFGRANLADATVSGSIEACVFRSANFEGADLGGVTFRGPIDIEEISTDARTILPIEPALPERLAEDPSMDGEEEPAPTFVRVERLTAILQTRARTRNAASRAMPIPVLGKVVVGLVRCRRARGDPYIHRRARNAANASFASMV